MVVCTAHGQQIRNRAAAPADRAESSLRQPHTRWALTPHRCEMACVSTCRPHASEPVRASVCGCPIWDLLCVSAP
eukprot:4629151-Prymnesium_polylepis.1